MVSGTAREGLARLVLVLRFRFSKCRGFPARGASHRSEIRGYGNWLVAGVEVRRHGFVRHYPWFFFGLKPCLIASTTATPKPGNMRRGVMLDRAINPQLSPYPLIFIVEDECPSNWCSLIVWCASHEPSLMAVIVGQNVFT